MLSIICSKKVFISKKAFTLLNIPFEFNLRKELIVSSTLNSFGFSSLVLVKNFLNLVKC